MEVKQPPELPLELALQRRIIADEITNAQSLDAVKSAAIDMLDLWLGTRAVVAKMAKPH